MKQLIILFILFSVFQFTEIFAQRVPSHLEPINGYYVARHATKIRTQINGDIKQEFNLTGYNLLFRFIKMPSFEMDEVLGLYLDNEKYYLIYTLLKEDSKEKEEKNEMYRSEIDSKSTSSIISLFSTAINGTKEPPKDESGFEIVNLDGTYFYFINESEPVREGQTWSPNKGTLMFELVSVVEEFIELTKQEKPIKFDDELKKRIKSIEKDLLKED